MAIKSGELIHVGNQVLVDRAQTAGPGTLNIPQEIIYELGNYQSVGIVRDIPDLQFDLESLDASAQLEALLVGIDFSTMGNGDMVDMSLIRPMDVASQFLMGRTASTPFEVEASVAIPFVMASSVEYKLGLSTDAAQTVQLAGDALYYANGSAYVEEYTGTQMLAGHALAHTVIPYEGDVINGTRYALAVTIEGSGKRLLPFVDFTEVATGGGATKTVTITVLAGSGVLAGDKVRIIYQSDVVGSYPQASHAPASTVKPAALRGRDLEIRVAGSDITDRWSSIQSATVTWSVTLERDEEFGNPNVIGQDFEVPSVKGSVDVKPRDVAELILRVQQIAGVVDDSVTGPLSSVAVPVEVLMHSPIDGHVLKTLYVPEARFSMPGFSGKVQTKLTTTFPFESDTGNFYVFKGERPQPLTVGVSTVAAAGGTITGIAFAGFVGTEAVTFRLNGTPLVTTPSSVAATAGAITGIVATIAATPVGVYTLFAEGAVSHHVASATITVT